MWNPNYHLHVQSRECYRWRNTKVEERERNFAFVPKMSEFTLTQDSVLAMGGFFCAHWLYSPYYHIANADKFFTNFEGRFKNNLVCKESYRIKVTHFHIKIVHRYISTSFIEQFEGSSLVYDYERQLSLDQMTV